MRCFQCFYVRQHRRSTKADTRIPRTQGETSRPGHLADTSITDWHRAQRKIKFWAITRLARRGRRAEEPPRLSSTTRYILQEPGRPLITVFMSSCKRVYRRMPVAAHPFCYTVMQAFVSLFPCPFLCSVLNTYRFQEAYLYLCIPLKYLCIYPL